MPRLHCLDGLRGFLASYVMLSHLAPFAVLPAALGWMLAHGSAAVDVFFSLSGLVIVRSILLLRGAARPFLIARAARIFPVFLVVFSAAILVQAVPAGFDRMPWIPPDGAAHYISADGWPRLWIPEILMHLLMIHGMAPQAVVPNAWISFLGAAWSLSTEWQFYVAVLLLMRWGLDRTGLVAMFLLIAVAGLSWDALADDPWRFSRAFLPNKAQYFALGIAAARLLDGGKGAVGTYALALLAALLLCFLQGGLGKLAAPLVWTLCVAAECGVLRPHRAGAALAPLACLLRGRLPLALGAISYPLYLVNEPLQRLLAIALAHLANGDAVMFTIFWLPFATLLPLAAAAWLHVHVERPGLRYGRALMWRQDVREPAGHDRR